MERRYPGDPTTDGERPCISVVITTRGRPAALVEAVRSVLAGTPRDVEVVVVDQGEDDEAGSALARAFPNEARLRHSRDDGRGSSRGRNAGLRLARAEIVAITDDDCVVPLDWAKRIVDAFERMPDVDLIYGQVDAPPHDYSKFVVPVALWQRRRVERGLDWRSARLQGISANMAARRRLFEAIGGFDEWFGVGAPRWCSEDFELHYRTLVSGHCVLIEPEITVLHNGRRSMDDAWTLWRRDALGNGALTAHILRRGHPLAAVRFWWWNVGRVGLNAFFRIVLVHRPTGLRLAAWMIRHSLMGFLAEWRAPGQQLAVAVAGQGAMDHSDEQDGIGDLTR